MKLTILPILAVAGLAACAQSPGSIAPVSMGNAYAGLSCTDARTMLDQERQTLAALESAQQGAVVGDAIGVFLLALPVSSLTGGDREGEIATSKGKVVALEARLASC
jgi:hypothetical protein